MAEKKKILIIEDERAIAGALELKLNNSGFLAKVACNGKEALSLMEEFNFDFVLLDLVMPGMNGFEFLEEFKERGNNIPVIVLSNLSQEEDIMKAKNLGAKHYFIKSNTSISKIVEYLEKELQKG